jgi:hypothetical protein
LVAAHRKVGAPCASREATTAGGRAVHDAALAESAPGGDTAALVERALAGSAASRPAVATIAGILALLPLPRPLLLLFLVAIAGVPSPPAPGAAMAPQSEA